MNINISTIIKSMRLPLLVLTPSCIFLAYAALNFSNISVDVLDLSLIFIGALAAHISVNTFNEYFDFRSGLDEMTVKTPFSGGSGGLIDNPNSSTAVLITAILSLLITILIGIIFVISKGPILLTIGIIGVLIIVSYTQWLNRSPLICHITPGLAFGPLMIIGTYWILAQQFNVTLVLISLVPFLLNNNLLLVNQLPDIKADTKVGRRTFPIIYGIENSLTLYLINNLIAAMIIILSVSFKLFPIAALLSIVPLCLCLVIYKGLKQNINEISNQQFSNSESFLGMNVAMTLLTPLVLALTLIFFK